MVFCPLLNVPRQLWGCSLGGCGIRRHHSQELNEFVKRIKYGLIFNQIDPGQCIDHGPVPSRWWFLPYKWILQLPAKAIMSRPWLVIFWLNVAHCSEFKCWGSSAYCSWFWSYLRLFTWFDEQSFVQAWVGCSFARFCSKKSAPWRRAFPNNFHRLPKPLRCLYYPTLGQFFIFWLVEMLIMISGAYQPILAIPIPLPILLLLVIFSGLWISHLSIENKLHVNG